MTGDGVSVIIPAFNEEDAIVRQVEEVHAVMRSTGRPYEIIVVDDGSSDRTAERAAGCEVKLLRRDRNYGYGSSLKFGITAAAMPWILITDSDGTYPSSSIPDLLAHIPEFDMVVGSRTGAVQHIPGLRRPAKWFLRLYASLTSGHSIPDLNSGMRLMRKSVVESFFSLLPARFSFTTTITLAMLAAGFRVTFVPIDYFRRVGKSKITPLDFFRIFRQVTRLGFLFNPMRLLMPVAMALLFLGFVDFRYGYIPVDQSGQGLAGMGGMALVVGALAQFRARQIAALRGRADGEIADRTGQRRLVRALGSVAFLLALAFFLPKDGLLAALRVIRPEILLAAVPLYLLIHLIAAWKWRMLVNRAGGGVPFVDAARYYGSGLLGNLFLPSVIGGDVVMLAVAMQKSQNKGAIVVGSVLNRALDLASLVIISMTGGFLLGGALEPRSRAILQVVLIGAAMATGLFIAVLLLLRPDRLPRRLRGLYDKHRAVIESIRYPRMYAAPLAISVAGQFCFVALNAWIAGLCGIHISFSAWLLAWPLAKLVAFVPVTLGGIGAREVALVALLAPLGVDPNSAVAAGLAWEGVLVSGSLCAGLLSRIEPAARKEDPVHAG